MRDTAYAPLDLEWFRHHAVEEIIPRWLAAVDRPDGLFLPRLDREWRPTADQAATVVSQGRLVYDFCQGWALTGEERYLDAARRGADCLLDRFRDHEFGGWYWMLGPGGEVLDATKDSYGHAFAVFGLAHAALATGSTRYRDAALEAWTIVRGRLSDQHGGVLQRTDRQFRATGADAAVRSQNPVMHLFEAALALAEVPGAEAVFDGAARLVEWVTGSLVRADGTLPEIFDNNWRALPTHAGGWINVGHHFEWAFLLARAVECGMDDGLLRSALALLSFALSRGVDDRDGGVYTELPVRAPFTPQRHAAKGWWEQCEATRALLRFGLGLNHAEFVPALSRNVAFFRAHLIDPEHGGWYSSADAPDKSKGNEWKLDYHVVGMCMEAVRYAGSPEPATTPP